VAVAAPGAEQPGHGAAVGVQVVRQLERHACTLVWADGSLTGRQGHQVFFPK
jgi:hypothetical protein